MYIMIVTQCTRVYSNMGLSGNNYPVHVCMCSRVVCLVMLVC